MPCTAHTSGCDVRAILRLPSSMRRHDLCNLRLTCQVVPCSTLSALPSAHLSSCDVQCGQRVASIGISDLQYGQIFVVGAAGLSSCPVSFFALSLALFNVLMMQNSTSAIRRKLMTAVTNLPYVSVTPPIFAVSWSKFIFPNSPRSGLMISSTREFTIAVNAPPMMIPTAMSMTFPREMNSLNSWKNPFFFLSSAIYQCLLAHNLPACLPPPPAVCPSSDYTLQMHRSARRREGAVSLFTRHPKSHAVANIRAVSLTVHRGLVACGL